MLSPLIAVLFPLILASVKLLHLVNPGREWEILSEGVTYAEGTWESSFQFVTQVFIILIVYKITVTVFISKYANELIFSLSSPLLGSFSGQTLPPLVRSWFC